MGLDPGRAARRPAPHFGVDGGWHDGMVAAATVNMSPIGNRLHAAVLSIALLGVFLCHGAPGTADGADDPGSSAGAIVAHLQYREVDFAPLCREINVTRSTRFTR